MAQALDSAYEWGINPQNQGNLSAAQRLGLASLAPQGGYGLGMSAPRTGLNPYGTLPRPTFAPGAAGSAFSFEEPALESIAQKIANGTGPADVNSFQIGVADVGNPANAGANAGNKPYFDPNYPYESMLALKNWLAPQVQAGVAPAESARGLGYSGVGKYAATDAANYLDQLAPTGETGQQALGNDFAYLYGPNIANSLIKGTPSRSGDVIGSLPASLAPGATPFGDGSTNAEAVLLSNPNYEQGREATAPYTGELTDFSGGGGGFRVGPGPGSPTTFTQPGAPAQGGTPQFGLYDLASGNSYAGPGYWYNPNSPPDAAQMPWLANATPYSGS